MTSNLISIWEVLLMPDYALITWDIKINKTWFFPINSFNLAAHTYINKRHIHIYIYIHIHIYTYQQKIIIHFSKYYEYYESTSEGYIIL